MCFRILLCFFTLFSCSHLYAESEPLRINDLLPYASSEVGRFSLEYDSLSSEGGEYDLNNGSLDFYYSLSLINEFDIDKSMSEQQYISLNGLVPYEVASKASFYFQTEMNTTLRGKVDRKNILEAYHLINLDFEKRDAETEPKTSVVGKVKSSINKGLLLNKDAPPSQGLSLYLAGMLNDIGGRNNGLEYTTVKDIIQKAAMYDFMEVSILLYCKGRSLRDAQWRDITSDEDFPKRFPQVCIPYEQRALFYALPKQDVFFTENGPALSLEEALQSKGLTRYLDTEFLTEQYGSGNKRTVSRTFLNDKELTGKVYSHSVNKDIANTSLNTSKSLALSMIEQGLVSRSDIVKSADYMALLKRDTAKEDALAALLVTSPNVTITDKKWRNCTSNHFVNFEYSCAGIEQEVFIGRVPSALDVAEGGVSPLHAYYLNWYLSKGLLTKLEARSFLDRYTAYLKSTR